MSPGIGLFHLKLVFKFKETSAKISVLVTIFVTVSLIVAKAVGSGPSKLSITFGLSPRRGLFCLKLVFDYKEASAKISVLVTILRIKSLIEAKQVKLGPFKLLLMNFVMSPQTG